MGIETVAAQFLCAAKNYGVDFRETLTIGRQVLFSPHPDVLRRVFAARGLDLDPEEFQSGYADAFFEKVVGVESLEAMDYSAYEGAGVVHDLNQPLPPGLRNRYGVVYDGGTLEHVFNMPQALKSLMEMVRVGGWLAQVAPANNLMGHGFWQVSPELVYRCLSPQNGFEVHAVLLRETHSPDAWSAVRDPDAVRGRVELCNGSPTYLATLARKISDVDVFRVAPQQSDYVVRWGDREEGAEASRRREEEESLRRRRARGQGAGGRRSGVDRLKRLVPLPTRGGSRRGCGGCSGPGGRRWRRSTRPSTAGSRRRRCSAASWADEAAGGRRAGAARAGRGISATIVRAGGTGVVGSGRWSR